ncbi:hypothetical protein V5O48_015412 [Marasmius crinis-equi]|uniref:Uncharacterized protein n=1 Tax=Marasmius crinis-equi TaxID=585013 RepID=A0ABR3EUL3_9AGAR
MPAQAVPFQLRKLYIEDEYEYDGTSTRFWDAIRSVTSRLTSVKLPFFPSASHDFGISYSQLVELRIRCLTAVEEGDETYPERFLLILGTCRQLRTLVLNTSFQHQTPFGPFRVVLPSLTSLTIADYSWGNEVLASFCSCISVPSLIHLEVAGDDESNGLVVNMVARSSRHLRTLKYTMVCVDNDKPVSQQEPAKFTAWEPFSSTLVDFELQVTSRRRGVPRHDVVDYYLSALLAALKDAENTVLPKLQSFTLTLEDITVNTQLGDTIMSLMSARRAAGLPLRYLKLARLQNAREHDQPEKFVLGAAVVERMQDLERRLGVRILIEQKTYHEEKFMIDAGM